MPFRLLEARSLIPNSRFVAIDSRRLVHARRSANRRAENRALSRLHPPAAVAAAGVPARHAQGRRPAQPSRRRHLCRRSDRLRRLRQFLRRPHDLAPAGPPCDSCEQYTPKPAIRCAYDDHILYNQIIDAWSMRNWRPGDESGHDHFFATFDKFEPASDNHVAEASRP